MTTTKEAHIDLTAHHPATIIVTVNNREVIFHQHSATGAQIKEAAINQGVHIDADFTLFRIHGAHKMTPIRNDETIALHENETFRAVAPDDSSSGQ
jgi:hypothetical protein